MPLPLSRSIATLACVLALAAAGCRESAPLLLQPGTRLVYQVDYLGLDQYPFTVTVVRAAPAPVFDYHLDHPPSSARGRVAVTAGALQSAHRHLNFFEPGEHDYRLDDSTSVWVSRATYRDMAAGRPTPINLGPTGAPDDTLQSARRETFPVVIDGETVELPVLVAQTDDEKGLWVLDDPENPIILQMHLQWYLTIREVVPPGAAR